MLILPSDGAEVQLHAQADAQQRLFFRLGPDDRHKAGGHQLVHGVAKGTHAGQDEPVGFADGIGVGGDHRVPVSYTHLRAHET